MLRGGKYCRNCPPKKRKIYTCEWCNEKFQKYIPFKDSGVICKNCMEWLATGGGKLPAVPDGGHPIYADKSWSMPSSLPSFIGEKSLPYPVNDSQFQSEIEAYLAGGGKITVLPAMPDASFDGFFKTQTLEYSWHEQMQNRDSCTEEIATGPIKKNQS